MERSIVLRVAKGGERLDCFIAASISKLSRSLVQKLIADGHVTVNGELAKPSHKVARGEIVRVRIPPPEPTELVAESIPLDVVYEDAGLLVINKPAGMVVHPAPGHHGGTLLNAVLARCPDLAGIKGTLRPGIVHRLDKDTSGLILVAKNDRAQQWLQRQFKAREVEKTYLALVEGRLVPAEGRIAAPIARDRRHRKRMSVARTDARKAREAETEYRVLEYLGDYSLVEAHPRTGRTHQVRVHFASLGHPLVGDPVYGHRKQPLGLKRQFLHAWKLAIRLPSTDKQVQFAAEIPDDLRQVLQTLRGDHRCEK